MVDAALILCLLLSVKLSAPLLIPRKASGMPLSVRECVGRARSPRSRSLGSKAMWFVVTSCSVTCGIGARGPVHKSSPQCCTE